MCSMKKYLNEFELGLEGGERFKTIKVRKQKFHLAVMVDCKNNPNSSSLLAFIPFVI